MKYRRKLFNIKKIYDLENSNEIFLLAMKENIKHHQSRCKKYRDINKAFNFNYKELKNIEDISNIPALPTLFLKNNTLLSKPYNKLIVKTTSSGTSGKKTLSGFDIGSGYCGIKMVLKVFRFHKLLSLRRVNYLILGYKPSKKNQTAMAKALKAIQLLAPAKKVVYALSGDEGNYKFDLDHLINNLIKFSHQKNPVRIIGFPAYLKLLLEELNSRNLSFKFNKNSKVIIGGGWKGLFSEQIPKKDLYDLTFKVLGIPKENFKDHFSTAEHPINYVSCPNGNFHIPVFSRVVIRDVKTLAPVKENEVGLLNLITPILSSVAYGSILTDDLAILRPATKCGCGIKSSYFELIGRADFSNIKTCTQLANEIIEKGS